MKLRTGCKLYVFACAGLYQATVKRDIALKPLGNTTLRDTRLYLAVGESAYEAPGPVQQTKAFVLGQRPFDSSASRVTSKEESETETYELTEHTSFVQLGTSSSPVTAWMGTGVAVGGIAGTAGGSQAL